MVAIKRPCGCRKKGKRSRAFRECDRWRLKNQAPKIHDCMPRSRGAQCDANIVRCNRLTFLAHNRKPPSLTLEARTHPVGCHNGPPVHQQCRERPNERIKWFLWEIC